MTIFYGSKPDPYKFHHNLSIVVAILDRTKSSHELVSPIKNTCPSTDPSRKRPLRCVPPARNVWRRPWQLARECHAKPGRIVPQSTSATLLSIQNIPLSIMDGRSVAARRVRVNVSDKHCLVQHPCQKFAKSYIRTKLPAYFARYYNCHASLYSCQLFIYKCHPLL